MSVVVITGAAGLVGSMLRPRLARPGRTLRVLDIAPLTAGRTGLRSALVAMALAAVLGTSWHVSTDMSGAQDLTLER